MTTQVEVALLETPDPELQRAQDALRESEERFREAFDYAAIGMALVAADGRWLKVNHSLCEITGYSETELLATTFQAITHPDDLDADLAFVRQMLAGEIRYYHMEKRYFHKDGHIIWILLSVSLSRKADGTPRYFVGQIQDITRQKEAEQTLRQSEERFRALARQAPVGIFLTDAAGDCVFVNECWCRMAGMSPDEARGLGWTKALHPEDRERVTAEWYVDAVTRGEFTSEYRFRTPQGEVTWLLGKAVGLRGDAGELTGYLGVIVDTSERRRREEEQEALIGKLQGALATIKTLRELLPVCAWCRQVRTDEGYWKHLETHIQEELDVSFTHGICPACAERFTTKLQNPEQH